MSTADFRPIRKTTILDSMVVSLNVPETVAATYAAGTTYAINDRVGLAPVYGEAQIVYESIQAANTGHTPASSPTWWRVLGNVYPVYASGSSCALGGIVSNISTDVHDLYESLVAANTGNPLTDATKWLRLGSTNARKMLDVISNSITENAESIILSIAPGSLINSIALLGVDAASVTVAQTISGYSSTAIMQSHPVQSWYDYWYEPPLPRDDVVFMSIPPYAAATTTITISRPGNTARCGVLVVGRSRIIGKTQWGLSRGIKDFSRVTEDAWGGLVLTPGNYAKLINLSLHITPGFESEAIHLLTALKSTEAVFVASEDYDAAIVYGVLQDWNVPISDTGDRATISIRGLV